MKAPEPLLVNIATAGYRRSTMVSKADEEAMLMRSLRARKASDFIISDFEHIAHSFTECLVKGGKLLNSDIIILFYFILFCVICISIF